MSMIGVSDDSVLSDEIDLYGYIHTIPRFWRIILYYSIWFNLIVESIFFDNVVWVYQIFDELKERQKQTIMPILNFVFVWKLIYDLKI